MPHLASSFNKGSRLTFLVLEPQLLLDLLAGEVDDTGELRAVERLCDVVGAVVLEEGQQLLPTALLGQDLKDVGEAWTEEEHAMEVSPGRQVAAKLSGRGLFQPGFGALSLTTVAALVQMCTAFPHLPGKGCSLWGTHETE